MHAIDVLLPYYGNVELMKEAVQSVVAQTNPNWRLTVIDDCYPDAEPARWFASQMDPRITYLRNGTNLGANANYRLALSLAEAPVVVMMGADDVMLPDYAEVVLKSLTDFPQAEVVQPGVRVIDARGNPARTLIDSVKSLAMPRSAAPVLLQGEDMAAALLHAPWHYFPSLAWRCEAIARIGFRPEFNVVQDLALLVDVAAAGGAIVLTPEVVFHYRRHGGSDSSVRSLDGSRFDEERAFFRGQARRFAQRRWKHAAFAARLHWASRLNAASVLLASAARLRRLPAGGRLRGIVSLLRHMVA